MPLRLCNATATFQRLMAQPLTNVTKNYGNFIMFYVDDVVIAAPTLEDHIENGRSIYLHETGRLEMQSLQALVPE